MWVPAAGVRRRARFRRRKRALLYRPEDVRGDVRDEPPRARRGGGAPGSRREHPSLLLQVVHRVELVGELPLDRVPSTLAERVRAGVELYVVNIPAFDTGRVGAAGELGAGRGAACCVWRGFENIGVAGIFVRARTSRPG